MNSAPPVAGKMPALRAGGGAEFGAAGTRVLVDFSFGGEDGVGGDFGVEAGAVVGLEGFFDGAVFAGMEGDECGGGVGGEDVGEDGQEAVEVGEFAVDEYAEGLEGASGGVEFCAGGALECEVAGLADDGCELLGGGDGGGFAVVDDVAGDLGGVGFVAEFEEGVGELLFGEAVEEGGGGLAAGRVHSHVEGGVMAVGEASGGGVEVGGGDAEVGEESVDFFDA